MQASNNVQEELEAGQERLNSLDEDIRKILEIDMNTPKKQRSGLKNVGEEEPMAQQQNSRFKRSASKTRSGFKRALKEDETKALKCDSPLEQIVCNTSVAFKRVHEEEPETERRNLRVKRMVRCEVNEEEPTIERIMNEIATDFCCLDCLPGSPTHDNVYDVNEDVSRTTPLDLSQNHVLKAQSDAQCTAKNKRMFGGLMRSPQKFQDDESCVLEAKMAKIEKKLEEAELREDQLNQKKRLLQMKVSFLKEKLDYYKKKPMPAIDPHGKKAKPKTI